MGRIGNRRYEAFTTTRYYPTMMGRNLTFAPSQYGDAAPSGAVEGVSGASGSSGSSGWAVVGEGVSALLGLGGAVLGAREAETARDRESKRKIAESKAQADIEAKKAQTAALLASVQPQQQSDSTLPLILGGVALLAVLGIGGYLLVRK